MRDSRLQGGARCADDGADDTSAEADYIVAGVARRAPEEDWLPRFVRKTHSGGIERGLL